MEIINARIFTKAKKVRYQAEIKYDNISETDQVWFEFDEKYASFLTKTFNTWLVCFAPIASSLGQPLVLNGPVDRILLKNIEKSLHLIKYRNPSNTVIPIKAEILNKDNSSYPGVAASFFTGGIDSFYTVLHNDSVSSCHKIDYLISVLGFEIPLKNSRFFPPMIKKLSRIADNLEKELIIVKTNLMETKYKKIKWVSYYSYSLAAAALSLERMYSKVLLAANIKTERYKLFFWGDDPDLVPALSSGNIKFILDGAEANRFDKSRYISSYEIVLDNLKVCSKSKSYFNCSVCEKCYRTMVSLFLLNKLDKAKTFKKEIFDIKRASKIYFKRNDPKKYAWMDIKYQAARNNSLEIVNAINKSFIKSNIVNLFIPIANKIKYNISFRLGSFFERLIMKNFFK